MRRTNTFIKQFPFWYWFRSLHTFLHLILGRQWKFYDVEGLLRQPVHIWVEVCWISRFRWPNKTLEIIRISAGDPGYYRMGWTSTIEECHTGEGGELDYLTHWCLLFGCFLLNVILSVVDLICWILECWIWQSRIHLWWRLHLKTGFRFSSAEPFKNVTKNYLR